MTGPEHAALMDVRDRMRDRFALLASRRDEPGMQELTTAGNELRWQRYELLGMLETVNNERSALGKPPVIIDAVVKADQQACGHVDYAAKFPLYCAEIVYGVFPLVPEEG